MSVEGNVAAQTRTVFVGIRGTVLAIDRSNGDTLWQTDLKGTDFVNVFLQDGDLFAACRGRLYRLDPANGEIQWRNDLPGMGWGIVTMAGAVQTAAAAESRRRDERRAANAAS